MSLVFAFFEFIVGTIIDIAVLAFRVLKPACELILELIGLAIVVTRRKLRRRRPLNGLTDQKTR